MKETLLQLINSYAAARSSGDPILQQFAAGQLQTFLAGVELIGTTPTTEDTTDV
jgi:hypothetical protein